MDIYEGLTAKHNLSFNADSQKLSIIKSQIYDLLNNFGELSDFGSGKQINKSNNCRTSLPVWEIGFFFCTYWNYFCNINKTTWSKLCYSPYYLLFFADLLLICIVYYITVL